MADIRFKISGSSQPFVAQLFAAGGTTPIQQMCVDYAGTCNIFSNLQATTSYTLKIYDSIGCTCSCSMTTATAVGTTTLAPKTISIVGTPSKVGTSCTVKDLITITPALSIGESVTLNFTGNTTGGNNTNSILSISCKGVGTTTYTPILTNNNNGNSNKSVTVNYGDSLCYNISTTPITANVAATGSAQICLVGATSSQIIPAYGSRFKYVNVSIAPTTTVAPTTTIPPVEVAIACVTNSSSVANIIKLSGKVITSRALASGESVTLCIYTEAESETTTDAINTISAKGYVKTSPTSLLTICSASDIHAAIANKICYITNSGKITIDSSTVNSICLYIEANSNSNNAGSMYGNRASLRIQSIHGQTGTNFSINQQFNELCATSGYKDSDGNAIACSCKGYAGTTYPWT